MRTRATPPRCRAGSHGASGLCNADQVGIGIAYRYRYRHFRPSVRRCRGPIPIAIPIPSKVAQADQCSGGEELPAEHVGEDQRRDDGGVGLDDVLRRVDRELAPGDLLVRHRAGVGAVARRRIADLAEVAPASTSASCRSCSIIGTTQIGKSPAMPPPIWKKPIECCAERAAGTSRRARSCTRCRSARCSTFFTLPAMQCAAKMLPSVESSQPGTKSGRFFSPRPAASCRAGRSGRTSRARRCAAAVEELVRQAALAGASAACHSSAMTCSMRRIASSSGMQVSVTRLSWRSSSACSSCGVSSR